MTDVNCRNYHFIQTLAFFSLIFLLSELCGHGLALIITAVFYNPHEKEDYYHIKPDNLMLFPLLLHRFCSSLSLIVPDRCEFVFLLCLNYILPAWGHF